MRVTRTWALLAVLAALAVVLTSCGGSSSDDQPTSTVDQPAITGEPAGFNQDDVSFAINMIASRRQTVDLAALVPDRSTDSDLIALAAGISAQQTQEIEVMKVLLVQWNENPDTNTGGSSQGESAAGLVDQATVARLEASSGREFDTSWLQTMIGHQQGSIAMARGEIEKGHNVDAVSTARRVVDTQQAQIGQLQQLLPTG